MRDNRSVRIDQTRRGHGEIAAASATKEKGAEESFDAQRKGVARERAETVPGNS